MHIMIHKPAHPQLRGTRAASPTSPRRAAAARLKQQVGYVELLQEVGVEATRLDGQEVELPLLVALAQDVLLDRVLVETWKKWKKSGKRSVLQSNGQRRMLPGR